METIMWTFMKLRNEYRIKEPGELAGPEKSSFFKLNILPATGRLTCKSLFQDYYHEGEKGQMSIMLTNSGVKKVEQIYIAVGEEAMFGFRVNKLKYPLEVGEERIVNFNINIPLISEQIKSGEEKKICKIILLYETGGQFRVSRTINKFNIVRVAKIERLICERLSTHLHLLSFTKNNQDKRSESAMLEWMVLARGFEIVKMEAAELSAETNYFFFLRKGNFGMSTFYFV